MQKGERMKTITDVNISGKRVFCRVDFNVPLDENRQITDDSRIRAALPTLQHVLANQGKLIVASHLGRPKGEEVEAFSLSPVARRLEELLGAPVQMAPDCIGPEVEAMVSEMAPGQVVLLENLRFHKAEQENDDGFGKRLAALCDVYVNDAFAVSHRANASVVAIVPHVAESAAGMLLKRELDYFQQAMAKPQRPLVAVVGGAKVSSKLAALTNMLEHVDKVIIGGAMANTFLRAKGLAVGSSKVEEDLMDAAQGLMKTAAQKGIKLYLPVDAVVASAFDPKAATRRVPVQEIPDGWMVLDIGPATSLVYSQALDDAKTIVWNGPMGVFEMDPFSRGTMAMASSIASAHALTIVGGGDTDAALHMAGETDRVSYISTGGGAFLSLLEGKALPAVAALQAASDHHGDS
jgi:phosphoglycerate kinase